MGWDVLNKHYYSNGPLSLRRKVYCVYPASPDTRLRKLTPDEKSRKEAENCRKANGEKSAVFIKDTKQKS